MRIRGYSYLFSGMAVVGIYVALSKPLTQAFPVFLLATLRFGIAAVLMLPWLNRTLIAGQADAPLSPELKTTLFWQSFFGNFLFSIFMLFGVSQTSATASGVILATLPAVVALFSWGILNEKLNAATIAAVGLAFAGVAALSMAKASQGGISLVGNLLVFCCVGCEAVYIILGKRLTQSLSPQRISALINLVGLCLMAPLGIWQALSFDFYAVTFGTWALLIFYAIAASMLSTALWLTGLKSVPASHSGVFTIALPLSATVVGVSFLGEQLSWVHGLSFACAVAGILLIAYSARRSESASSNA
jgi:drug/metabolite transporter (DMT)-like permease